MNYDDDGGSAKEGLEGGLEDFILFKLEEYDFSCMN